LQKTQLLLRVQYLGFTYHHHHHHHHQAAEERILLKSFIQFCYTKLRSLRYITLCCKLSLYWHRVRLRPTLHKTQFTLTHILSLAFASCKVWSQKCYRVQVYRTWAIMLVCESDSADRLLTLDSLHSVTSENLLMRGKISDDRNPTRFLMF